MKRPATGHHRAALRTAHAALLALAGCAALTCSRDGDPAPGGAKAPARVEGRRPESDLPVVHLEPEAEQRLGIATAAATEKSATRVRTYAGEVVVPPGRMVQLVAPFAAIIEAPDGGLPDLGSVVAGAAVLLRLKPELAPERLFLNPPEQSLLARHRADLSTAAAETEALGIEAEALRREAERARELLGAGSGSSRAVDEAQARFEAAGKRLDGARARQRDLAATVPPDRSFDHASDPTAHAPPASVPVRAPFAATVIARAAAAGATVAAGSELVALADLTELWLRVAVPAVDRTEIDGATSALVTVLGAAAGSEGVTAPAVATYAGADAARATFDAWFTLGSASARFRLGERVSATLAFVAAERAATALPTSQGITAIVVPSSALIHDVHGGTWVYVKTGERAYSRRRVEVARVVGADAWVARGLAPGAEVVTAGAAELYGTEFGAGK